MELPVVNHEAYVAKIGDDHKFPINKFGELANYLINQKIVKKFYKPYPCSFETLNRAHSENYINNIKNKTLDKNGVKKIGFPLVDSVVQRSLVATGGTVLASKLALNFGIACNTAGGSHHANYDSGAGYCVFNDVAVAAHYLLDRGLANRILIVDLDVHQGNGNSEIFFDVSINLSNCSSEIFPLLISFDLILACSARILVDSCSDDISSEKKAIVDFFPLSCNF